MNILETILALLPQGATLTEEIVTLIQSIEAAFAKPTATTKANVVTALSAHVAANPAAVTK